MRRILFAIIVGLGGAAILLALGVWQVQRLGQKQEVLGLIEATISGEPVTLRAALEPEFQRYAPVALTGTFGQGHVRMLASRKTTGAVYRIIRPFNADEYGLMLVDTGWQLQSADVVAAPLGQVSLVGNLDAPNETDSFTPPPDISDNIWFARDVDAMARALNTEAVLVCLRDAPAVDLGVTPWPVDTVGIPNDHLQYAITWFSLAVIWLGMSLYFLRRKKG